MLMVGTLVVTNQSFINVQHIEVSKPMYNI